MTLKRFSVSGLAALALLSAPLQAQTTTPTEAPRERGFDTNILLYAALPALIALTLIIAASSGDDDQPTSP